MLLILIAMLHWMPLAFHILYNADSFGVYLFVINGAIDAESYALEKRDGIGIGDAEEFDITAREDSTVLLIEVPPVE